MPDDQGIGRNLITEYGRVTMANVMAHAASTNVHIQTRDAQNSAQLFTCVYDSLLLEALLKVSTDSAAYRRLPSPANPAVMVASGACFLKLIVTRCTVDSRSTVATIRRTLNSLDKYMLLVNCDIAMHSCPEGNHRLTFLPISSLLTKLWKTRYFMITW